MNAVQIGSAACVPLNPTGRLSSKPTQTTVSSLAGEPDEPGVAEVVRGADLPAASSAKPAARRRRSPR